MWSGSGPYTLLIHGRDFTVNNARPFNVNGTRALFLLITFGELAILPRVLVLRQWTAYGHAVMSWKLPLILCSTLTLTITSIMTSQARCDLSHSPSAFFSYSRILYTPLCYLICALTAYYLACASYLMLRGNFICPSGSHTALFFRLAFDPSSSFHLGTFLESAPSILHIFVPQRAPERSVRASARRKGRWKRP